MEGQDITITAENKNVILLPLLKNNPINDDIAYLQVTPVE